MKRFPVVVLLAIAFVCFAANADKVKTVLVVGDSISIGYTPVLEKSLAPDIVVTHIPENGGSTVRGVEKIEKWLDNKQWDVILFNFGLHDLVHKDKDNKYDVNGQIAVTLEEYKSNLEIIVGKLKETTATLIFVTTTVVPENSTGRKVEDPAKYNAIALEVMKKHHIQVVDLYTASLTIHPQNSKPGNVHYSPEGYDLLAQPLIKAIKTALSK